MLERGHMVFTVVVFTTPRLQFLGIREQQKIFIFLLNDLEELFQPPKLLTLKCIQETRLILEVF